MSKTFSATEKNLLLKCKPGTIFTFQKKRFEILLSGKPSPTDKGECKTDIYILAEDVSTKIREEFKISIKQSNAAFLENKIKLERAIQIFGSNTKEMLVKSIKQIEQYFEKEDLIFFDKKGQTQEKSIKLGWRFELFNKKQGDKSEALLLTNEQKLDIYSGTNLSDGKKNSKVNGTLIVNSGVANFILILEEVDTDSENIDDYFSKLISIEEYSSKYDIYFGCKAVNYRADKVGKIKWDGDRPLAVYVDWIFENDQISCKIIYTNPLEIKSHEIGHRLSDILKHLKIESSNFSDIEKYLKKGISIYKSEK